MTAAALSTVERSTLVRAPRSRVWQALTRVRPRRTHAHDFDQRFLQGRRVLRRCRKDGCPGDSFLALHPGSKQPGEDHSSEPVTRVEFRLT